MENLDVPIPDLTEEQQAALSTTGTLPCKPPLLLHSDRFVFLTDIFLRVFAADAKYLENHEKMNQSFWESLVKCLAATDPAILDTEEKNNLLNSCDVLPGGCAACLETIQKKGVRAMALLYLLLKTSNPSGYRQLPSSKGKGQRPPSLEHSPALVISQGRNVGNKTLGAVSRRNPIYLPVPKPAPPAEEMLRAPSLRTELAVKLFSQPHEPGAVGTLVWPGCGAVLLCHERELEPRRRRTEPGRGSPGQGQPLLSG
ncbi:transmembrane protein 40 isoform X4 [Parus major]|uniref:transmembrane protein 40 isoform X4 n=1 Tax=Parus major TaxID=9157 RepID=UPI001443E89D|nr:transmembrane protein 40 isoform X4 [Parus major]